MNANDVELEDPEEEHSEEEHSEEEHHNDDIQEVLTEEFVLYKRIVVKDIPIFNKVCMQYMFKKKVEDYDYNTLIFVKKKQIFSLNFEKETIQILYQFGTELNLQPNYFISNEEQDIFLVASQQDGFWVDLQQKIDVDIYDLYNIS